MVEVQIQIVDTETDEVLCRAETQSPEIAHMKLGQMTQKYQGAFLENLRKEDKRF